MINRIPVLELLARVVSIEGGMLRWVVRLRLPTIEVHPTRRVGQRSLGMLVSVRSASDEPYDLVSFPKSDYDCGYSCNGGDDDTGDGSLRPAVVRVCGRCRRGGWYTAGGRGR